MIGNGGRLLHDLSRDGMGHFRFLPSPVNVALRHEENTVKDENITACHCIVA
jgi:hypothetical protein